MPLKRYNYYDVCVFYCYYVIIITQCLSQNCPRIFADTSAASVKGISELNESKSFVHRYTWNTNGNVLMMKQR